MKAGVDLNLGIEHETLEFKKSTGELKEAMYSICAILNKHTLSVQKNTRPEP